MLPRRRGALAGISSALWSQLQGRTEPGWPFCRRCMLPLFSPRGAMSPKAFGAIHAQSHPCVPLCPWTVGHHLAGEPTSPPPPTSVPATGGAASRTGVPEVTGVPTPCTWAGGASGHFGGECGHLTAVPSHVPSTASVSAEETKNLFLAPQPSAAGC